MSAMPSIERDASRDSDKHSNHQYFGSLDCGRALVPMWDSSDPERAPPPLPMNPSSPSVASRPNTSSAIKSAHAALTEKAREGSYNISLPPKRIENSPEKSLAKGAAHKRMQSLQSGNVRDLSCFLEGGSASGSPKSPEKSPSRHSSPHAPRDTESKPLDREPSSRCATPTSGRETPNRDMPPVRPSLRRPPQSILGENTPPQSATMLALQNMAGRDTDPPPPLSNVTNGSNALVHVPRSFDAISNQILSLTSIATNLQREMANLSRRSKDNATDLVSLKEATNSRDEDIRKSLRELVTNLSEGSSRSTSHAHSHNGLFLENKAHNSPTSRNAKGFSLPRIPTPNSFAAPLDRESVSSPSSFAPDGAATIALVEKILREMGTKEGQELLVSRLAEISKQLAHDGMATANKLDDLVEVIKRNNISKEIIPHTGGGANRAGSRNFSFEEHPRLDLDFDHPRSGAMTQRVEALLEQGGNKENIRGPVNTRASDLVNEDLLKIIRSVKDSIAQGGGLTAEVKALVRELRGEVLGMGREIGRKLDEAKIKDQVENDLPAEKERMVRVIEDGLDELRHHMDNVLREHRRQSASSVTSRNAVDYQEIYNAMRAAVNEKDRQQYHSALRKEDIIDAVKDAWENYKPEVELQHFGLERDELLACLKEGIQEHSPPHDSRQMGATREEVFTAVVEGLKHFSPPRVESEATMSRDEILDAVRECLEEFEFPAAPVPEPREPEFTRDDVLGAVREGLHTFEFPGNATIASRDLESGLRKEDVIAAVAEGLNSFKFPDNAATLSAHDSSETLKRDEVLSAVRECLETFDFPINESGNRCNVDYALIRDEVLDALKEGLENFDFAAYATTTTALSRDVGQPLTREDVFDAVRSGMGESPPMDSITEQVMERLYEISNSLQSEFKAVSDEAKQNVAAHGRDTEQVLDATKDGFEKLRSDIEGYVDQAADVTGKDEILDSMHESFETLRIELRALVSKDASSSLDAVQNEIEHLRETIVSSITRAGVNSDNDKILESIREGLESIRADFDRPRDSNESILSGTGEILDAVHDGMNGIRSEIERIANKPVEPVDMTVNYEILDTLKAGLEGVRADIDRLREDGIGDRAVAEVANGAVVAAESLKRNDIENLEVLIAQLRIKVEALESMPHPPPQSVPGSLSREDLVELEEMMRNVQESVASITSQGKSADGSAVNREDFEAIETLLQNTKAKIDEMDPEQVAKKAHLDGIELLIAETREGVLGITTQLEDISKIDDINNIETLVQDVLGGLEELKVRVAKDADDVEKVTKTDVEAVEAVCLDIKTAIEQMVISDIATLASKDEVKTLGEMVKEFKGRIETHAETNAKAFEDRQAETVGVGERVTEIKTFIEEFRDAMKEKLEEGTTGVETLGRLLEALGETVANNATTAADINMLSELVKEEFEKSNAGVVGVKLEHDEKYRKTAEIMDSFNMKFDGIDIKFDEKFNELMTKYDDAQIAAEINAKEGEVKNAETEATLLGTKAVAEELKSFIDLLGTTLTDSVERMDEASKTVFTKVEDTFTRVEETHADAKAEHQLTREQVFKSISVIEGVQNNVTEFNPRILESIKDILLIVGQHYEHSKTSNAAMHEKIEAIPTPCPPVEVPLLPEAPPQAERYDDTIVQEKLDKLVDHMHVAGKSFAQLEVLDKIQQQVIYTASQVSEFISAQTQRITDDHEDKEKAIEAATIVLEKQIAQKESVETIVSGLREEEEKLKNSVSNLKAEQEALAHQKMRLSADVSSMETALRIRREELHAMEARAEGLERRILEGVIDHSRALLISKTNKGQDAMSRRRVPSHTTLTEESLSSRATSRTSYSAHNAVNIAMSGSRSIVKPPFNTSSGDSRRILSLNQITSNVPNGASVFKRSHSVKAPGGSGALRKSSWGGSLSKHYGDLNKENLALKESEEDEDEGSDDELSENRTMRRSSYGTTILTGTVGESAGEGTEWTGSDDGRTETDLGDRFGDEQVNGVVLYGESEQAV